VTGDGRTGAKPTAADLCADLCADLGGDPSAVAWERSGEGAGSIEIAMPGGTGARWARGDWVLMRVAGDPAGRILVFDRNEWECFVDGARNGEFDDAAELSARRLICDSHFRYAHAGAASSAYSAPPGIGKFRQSPGNQQFRR
jgi:Domain of unknown function (DUF397)